MPYAGVGDESVPTNDNNNRIITAVDDGCRECTSRTAVDAYELRITRRSNRLKRSRARDTAGVTRALCNAQQSPHACYRTGFDVGYESGVARFFSAATGRHALFYCLAQKKKKLTLKYDFLTNVNADHVSTTRT